MASIIMHMAVAMNIMKSAELDTDRFLLGTILPDYIYGENPHYRDFIGDCKFFNISRFRTEYSEGVGSDPVYLGYYLHLVQDLIFRDMIYNVYDWSSASPERVKKLYGDYHKLNSYVMKKYRLSVEMIEKAVALPKEVYGGFVLNTEEFIDETDRYIRTEPEHGEYYFFTPDMAEEFILKATEACHHELAAFKGQAEHLDEKEYCWKISREK